jgi:signal transduction histidine kinase
MERSPSHVFAPIGEGVLGRVCLTGEPVVLSDHSSYTHRGDDVQLGTFGAVAAVPLRWGESVLGVLGLADDEEGREFDESDVKVLHILAAHASIALENARVYADTTRRFEESQALLRVSQAMTAVLDLPDLLQLIVGAAVDTIPNAEAGVIHLLDNEGRELIPRALSYRPEIQPEVPDGRRMRSGEGIAGRAIRAGECINVQDVDRDPRFVPVPGSRKFKSLLVAPLMLGRQRLGTLSVDSSECGAFDPEDERLLTLLSAQASVAISNANLYQETVDRSEDLRSAYSRLRETATMRDDFVAKVSHELKSPLAPLRIAVERTLSEDFGVLNHMQREMLQVAVVNVDKLQASIEELLDVVRLKAGEDEPAKRQIFDLRIVAQECVGAMAPSAEAAGVTFDLMAPESAVIVAADRRRIGQVVTNLLSNAIKFNRPLGKAQILVRRADDEWAEVVVSDTGIGIPEVALGKVFDRFYQVESSSTRKYEGLGLGLAIVKEYVEMDGGTVTVESQEGRGSVFSFTVPLG